MKKKRKIFESLRFNVFSFVYNVFLKFATPLESGEPKLFSFYIRNLLCKTKTNKCLKNYLQI